MAGLTLSEAIDKYLDFREGSNKSSSTVKSDRTALSQFLALVGNVQMNHLDSHHGLAFNSFLKEKKYMAETMSGKLSSLREFIKWAHQQRHLPATKDPLYGIANITITKKKRARVPAEDFDALLDCAHKVDAFGRTVHGSPHDRIVVALGLYLFLRQSEVMTLRIGWYDPVAMELDVLVQKGRGEEGDGDIDTMPVCEELADELRRWLTWYANDVADHHGPLQDEWYLVPQRHRPALKATKGQRGGTSVPRVTGNCRPTLMNMNPHQNVKRTLARYGMPLRDSNGKSMREGVHTLRRSGARALFNQLVEDSYDGALRQVSSMLHHASVTMTERYIGQDLDVKKRNDLLRGKRMYSKPVADNVVSLHRNSN